MQDRVRAAAKNHARWCDVVCRSHGIPTATTAGYWAALRRPPEGLPDVITLGPGATPADILRQARDEPGCSVQDSFADLDLAALGFDERSGPRWLFRQPLLPTVDVAAIWSVMETAEELAVWAHAAGAGEMFAAELLSDPSRRFLVARGGDSGVRAGAIATLAADVVGIWNLFTTRAMTGDEAWRTLPTAIANHFPMVPLVAYEQAGALLAPEWAGFADIGALRIWRRAG